MRSTWVNAVLVSAAILAPILALSVYLAMADTKPSSAKTMSDTATPIADKATSDPAQPASPTPAETPSNAPPPLPTIDDLAPSSQPRRSVSAVKSMNIPDEFPPPSDADPSEETVEPEGTAPNSPATIATGQPNPARNLRREGSNVADLVGSITKRGAHLTFIPADRSTPMSLLECQLLERIEQYERGRSKTGDQAAWKISGRITEYRGTNFLLPTSVTLLDPEKTP